MTEHEFHAARRMFAAHQGTVLVAPTAHPVSHAEWLIDLFGTDKADTWMRHCTRGYVLGSRLVAYRGLDFSPKVIFNDLVAALDVFERMAPGVITEIGLGAVPGPGIPWEPKLLTTPAELTAKLALLNNRVPDGTVVAVPETPSGKAP